MNQKSSASITLSGGLLMLILGSLQTVMPLSTDLYLPALPAIARDLNVSPGATQFTLAVFMIGVALGQITYGPITDKYGRKKPLLFGLSVYILGSVVCALAPSIAALIGGRFLQALGASASAVITAAIARDLWSGKVLADRLSLLFLVVGFAPIVAPSLGSVILLLLNWHGLFWFLVVFGIVVALSVTALPETSSPSERKQTRLREAAGTYLLLVRNTPFLLYVLTGACLVGVLFTHITGSSFLYIDTLKVTPGQFAALFSFTALGFIGATQFNRLLLKRMSLFSIVRAAVIAAVICSLLLLLVVVSGFATIVSLTLLLFALSAALGCAFPNVAALAFSTVQEKMGSASALQGTLQSVFGGIAGGLVSTLGNGATLPMMGIMTGFAILATVFLMTAHQRWPEAKEIPQ